jgi:hypothetical protein
VTVGRTEQSFRRLTNAELDCKITMPDGGSERAMSGADPAQREIVAGPAEDDKHPPRVRRLRGRPVSVWSRQRLAGAADEDIKLDCLDRSHAIAMHSGNAVLNMPPRQ